MYVVKRVITPPTIGLVVVENVKLAKTAVNRLEISSSIPLSVQAVGVVVQARTLTRAVTHGMKVVREPKIHAHLDTTYPAMVFAADVAKVLTLP